MQPLTKSLTAVVILALLGGCKIQSKSLRSKRSGSVLDTSFVFIERTPDRTEAIVRFRTKFPANCHLRYWPDSETGKESVVDATCANNETKTDFSEVIKPLSVNDLYTVEIAVWGQDGAFSQAEKFIVNEGENALEKNDLFVARVNLQLRTAEIHRHRLANNASDAVLEKVMIRDYGCDKNLASAIAFTKPHQAFKVNSLNFRGFASGEATAHKYNSSYRRIRFNTIARANEWVWNFSIHGKSFSFNLDPAPLLTKALLETDSSLPVEVKDAQLTLSPREVLSLDKARDVDISWISENASKNSYIVVQVGNITDETSFSCVFDSSTKKATLPEKLIKKLPKKKHDLYIGLVSYQLDLTNQEQSKPAWLIEATDWKLGALAVN